MRVSVCGYGVVGKGVVEILDRNDVNKVKYIFTKETIEDKRQAHDFDEILKDDEVKIVVEAMGGLEPAFSMMKQALSHQKHVVTSNKELVEKHGAKLHELALVHGVNFLFEASVGGGMPLISTLRHGLYAENILSIQGILNGTSNYILTKMREEKLSFKQALKEAQDLGFAEKDPTDDVEGFDAGRKIAILASILTQKRVDFQDVDITGISAISEEMIDYANKHQKRIRLVAKVDNTKEGIKISVMPTLLGMDHPFYHVEYVNNAVLFHGQDVGDVLIQGAGAGRYPTASAIVSDVYALNTPNLPKTDWTQASPTILKGCQYVYDFKKHQKVKRNEVNHQAFLAYEGETQCD